ncbi:uncharacterized protein LOC125203434 [Salvia hispanica]|uniref:uncharacterized protein LOC125203434 n=1 Tax=Salvia hispanica TaxID=49212 RepID=UPI0020091396|nr:uncharacterized protein LOC125203434 [Salvia hispanica]
MLLLKLQRRNIMSLVSRKVDEISVKATGGRGRVRPHTTVASVESLAIPLVEEVVFMADFRCSRCRQRVAEIINKMNGETQSLVISVVEKTVTLTLSHSKRR